MDSELKQAPRKWSLEEIDELLRDSGILNGDISDIEETDYAVKKAEAVDPRPVYDKTAEHKIKSKIIEESDSSQSTRVFGALESDKYRERFLNRPVQNIEKTAEHIFPAETKMYERGGFVKKESSFKRTKELDPVPTLVSDDILESEQEEENRKTKALRSFAVTNGNAHEEELEYEDDSQLTFEGFNTEDDVITQVDEEAVEKELIEKRREKAADFVLSKEAIDPVEEETPKFGTDEYRTVNDKFKVAYYLDKKRKSAFIAIIINAVSAVLSCGISLIVSSIDVTVKPFLILNLLLILICGVASFATVKDGIINAVKLKFNRNSAVSLSLVFSLIYAFALLACKNYSSDYGIFTAAALVGLLLNSVSEYIEYSRIKKNFDIISENEYYSIGRIDNSEDAFEIGRGLLLDEPHIISSQKTQFPGRFLELSRKYYPSDELSRKTVPIVSAVSLIIGAVTFSVSKDFYFALGAICAVLSVGMPYFLCLTDAVSIFNASKKALNNGGVISGWDAYRECASSNAVTVEASDIFDSEGGNIFGIKTFYSMKADDAILNTAAMLVASEGPLGNLFKRVILGKTELLPPVENLTYEYKLGLSGWIQNRRVLVGSVDLLRNHSVEAPEHAFIERFVHDGRYPLFLAIEGKLAAMFIVSYDINQENRRYLREIERNGLSLLIRADDSNVTEEMISEAMRVHLGGIKVLNSVSSDIYKNYKKKVRSAADSLLMHNGEGETYIKCISTVLSLGRKKQLSSVIQIGAVGVGTAIVAALGFTGFASLQCSQLVLTQLIFTGIALFAVKSKK